MTWLFPYYKFSESGQTFECALGHAVLMYHYFFLVLGLWVFANLSGSHNNHFTASLLNLSNKVECPVLSVIPLFISL